MTDTPARKDPDSRCGFVGQSVGAPMWQVPNPDESHTGQKLSITSVKPQTTRHQVFGLKTIGPVQACVCRYTGMHEENRGR